MHTGLRSSGAMFLAAWIGTCRCWRAGLRLYHRTTVLDLVLRGSWPASDRQKRARFFGHGGLCQDCPECVFRTARSQGA